MAYSLPTFNLLGNAWTAGHTPAADPPDSVNNACQLYVNAKAPVDQVAGTPTLYTPTIFLRMTLTGYNPVAGDIWEIVPGSGDYYKTRWVQVIHLGFANAYRLAVVEQCDATGATPRP